MQGYADAVQSLSAELKSRWYGCNLRPEVNLSVKNAYYGLTEFRFGSQVDARHHVRSKPWYIGKFTSR